MRSRRLRLALLAGTAIGFAASPTLAAVEIGVAAAVNPMAQGTPPAQETRVLRIGADMIADERVATGARGQAQLLFLDGTALTVGPNSEVVLDTFVYDPQTGNGELAFSATKGVLRLVGGSLSKRAPVTIRTPTATIGVRGGIALVRIGEEGVSATLLFGEQMTVTSDGVTRTATRPGFRIDAPAGDPPEPPAPIEQQQIERTLTQLEGGGDQDGGLDEPLTDEDVVQSQIAEQNSVQGTPPANGVVPPNPGGGTGEPQDEVTEASQNEMAETADSSGGGSGDDGGGEDPDDQSPPTGVNIAGTLSGRFKRGTEGAGTSDGVSGQDIQFAGATVAAGVFAGGGFTLPVEDGAFSVPPTALSPFGGAQFSGTGWLSPGSDFLIYELSDGGMQRVLGFAGKPTAAADFPSSGFTAYAFRPDFVLRSDVPFIRAGGQGLTQAAPAKGYVDWSTGAFVMSKIVLEGQGTSQRATASVFVGRAVGLSDPMTADINGRFRGSASVDAQELPYIFENGSGGGFALQRDGAGAGFFGASGPDYFVLGNGAGAATEKDPSGGVATYNPNAVAQKTTGVQGTKNSATLTGFVGGLAQEIGSTPNVYAISNRDLSGDDDEDDPDNFQIVLDQATGTLTGSVNVNDDSGYGLSLNFGGSDVGESAFFDDDTFAATEGPGVADLGQLDQTSDYSFFLTTADGLETIGAVPAGVSLCSCQYLRWGVLSMDLGDPDLATDRTQVQLAGWVAGQITDAMSLPATGTATYLGHAFGNVHNGSDFYSAIGGVQVQFDFSTRMGDVDITDFDGADYSASISPSIQSNGVYSASGTGLNESRSVVVRGAFFAGGGDPAAETGGKFSITGSDYEAAGVFAASKSPPLVDN